METVVQLRADLAHWMQGDAHSTWPDHITKMKLALDNELGRLGASLKPMHPGTQETELARYFTLSDVSDAEKEAVLVALRGLEGVTAAYSKPEAEPA